jgi:hypothetical protein
VKSTVTTFRFSAGGVLSSTVPHARQKRDSLEFAAPHDEQVNGVLALVIAA